LKKREQNKKQREIESDPSWDDVDTIAKEEPSNDIEQLLNDLFEQNPKISQPHTAVKEVLVTEENELLSENLNQEPDEIIQKEIIPEDDRISIDDQLEDFEDNIYHSKLAERKELYYGNKWLRRVNLKEELFRSKQSLRRSIIIKEILDKPLGMRD
jgi:hypothetical protein